MTLSTIADICGILGLLLGLFATIGVIKINKKINSNKVDVKDTNIEGDFTGRDKITK
ncbi:MAG: histone deacetylase complex regulatory component SIN3 [Parvicella sp.]|jgi:histone deacetylase complex regulatory component SIN3